MSPAAQSQSAAWGNGPLRAVPEAPDCVVQPRIILAMGRFAVQSLLRSDRAIGQLRGQVHDYQGVPLIVTYHPAYLLRNLVDKAKAWEDLCLAASVAERG